MFFFGIDDFCCEFLLVIVEEFEHCNVRLSIHMNVVKKESAIVNIIVLVYLYFFLSFSLFYLY